MRRFSVRRGAAAGRFRALAGTTAVFHTVSHSGCERGGAAAALDMDQQQSTRCGVGVDRACAQAGEIVHRQLHRVGQPGGGDAFPRLCAALAAHRDIERFHHRAVAASLVEPGHQQHHRQAPQHHQADRPVRRRTCGRPGQADDEGGSTTLMAPPGAGAGWRPAARKPGALRATWRARPLGQPATWALHASQTRMPKTARLISENQSSALAAPRPGLATPPAASRATRAPADQPGLREIVDRHQPGQHQSGARQRQQDREHAGLAAAHQSAHKRQRPQRPHEPGAELEQSRQLGRAQHRADDPLPLVAQPGPGVRVLQVEHERPQRGGWSARGTVPAASAPLARGLRQSALSSIASGNRGALIHRPPKPRRGRPGRCRCPPSGPGERACRQLHEAGQGQCGMAKRASRGCVSCACRTRPSVPSASVLAGVRAGRPCGDSAARLQPPDRQRHEEALAGRHRRAGRRPR